MHVPAGELSPFLRTAGPRRLVALLWVVLAAFAACSDGRQESTLSQDAPSTMTVTSDAFIEGAAIPVRYTCDGEDVSPPIAWSGIPDGTASIALVSDDPDAPGGTWVHWVAWRIPSDAAGFPENIATDESLQDGTRQGRNDFRKTGYGGPCPPPGNAHRYFFTVYALDAETDLPVGATKSGPGRRHRRPRAGRGQAHGHIPATIGWVESASRTRAVDLISTTGAA